MHCLICDDTPRGSIVDTMRFYLNDKLTPRTDVIACLTCGYVQLFPPIPMAELDDYYKTQGRIPTKSVAYKEQVNFISKYVKPAIRVMDIGAFDGRLLNLMAEQGATKTYSIEPDLDFKNNFTSLADALSVLGEDKVDLITMGHVFEHMQEPMDTLKLCKSLLQPGGALFIEVPDLEDPQIQVVPFWTPFHNSYFTQHTLAYMLEKAGFKVIAIEKTGYRAIRMIARCFTEPEANQGDTPPVKPTSDAVMLYHTQRTKFLNELADRLSWLEHENLAIFGAGDHSRWLLRFFPDLKKNLVCILDSDPAKQGDDWGRFPVITPEDCPDDVDRIIISSYDTQNEMATIVGKRAMLLYEDVRAYDVWLGAD